MRSPSVLVAALALATLAAVAFAPRAPVDDAPPRSSSEASELTIYGAASLKGALETARTAYAAAVPGTTLLLATDSSAALATQIQQGAPADVFLSADATNPRQLADAGLTDGAPVAFARNQLTIIVPTANPAGIVSPADLARPGVHIIAAGDAVPITGYAQQVIDALARETADAPGFVAAYASNIVSREDNVKAVVAKIELGEGDAAIVYATDAVASRRVEIIPIPDSANAIATYEGIVVETSERLMAARSFLDWFAGPAGIAILAQFGFLPPS